MAEECFSFKIFIEKIEDYFIATSTNFPDCFGKGKNELSAIEALNQSIMAKMDSTVAQCLVFNFNQEAVLGQIRNALSKHHEESTLEFIKRIFGGKKSTLKQVNHFECDVVIPISREKTKEVPQNQDRMNQLMDLLENSAVVQLQGGSSNPINSTNQLQNSSRVFPGEKLLIDMLQHDHSAFQNVRYLHLAIPFSIN